MRLNILVVYSAYTTRLSSLDTLYSFRKYTNHRIYYLNLRLRDVPWYVIRTKFDLIIFHNLFFSNKFDRERQLDLFKKAYPLGVINCKKVATPQDEFINSDIVCGFVERMGVSQLFTVQPKAVWGKIYGTLKGVQLSEILTGYIDPRGVRYCAKFMKPSWQRPITVGYRCIAKPLAWFGIHGYLKYLIAPAFIDHMQQDQEMPFDISTEEKEALHGLDWYEFLGKCKYVLGVESGTSIYDEKGEIKRAVEKFTEKFPGADYDSIEAECFPGADGNFSGFAISPRHLEACMTGTCQVLTEGYYNGILIPNIHYIPLKKDFSNIEEVIHRIKKDADRNFLTKNSLNDIVNSGKYNINNYPNIIIGPHSMYPKNETQFFEKTIAIFCYGLLRSFELVDRVIAILWNHIKKLT